MSAKSDELNALGGRKRAILGVVVERYVATGEPVSSAWVSESAEVRVSSATIRNEMSELERMGCLSHPHTSAGRVPTDRGYRLYVDIVMSEVQPEPNQTLFANLTREGEAGSALQATCRALARFTHYLSLAQPPSWASEKLRHLQLERLDAHRVLAVLLTESGRVHHAVLEFNRLPSAGQMRALTAVINARFADAALSDVTTERLAQAVRDLWPKRSFADRALKVLSASMSVGEEGGLVVRGGSQLLEAQEFREAAVARQVFDLIEEPTYLRRLLARQRPGLSAVIGDEADHPAMRYCALLSATFAARGGATGCIGVLGPKRMRYRPVMSALVLAARTLGSFFAGG
jgi:heat-inducible transcriptional repressor